MLRADGLVEHVGVRQDDVRALPDALPLGEGRVAVVRLWGYDFVWMWEGGKSESWIRV